jgi:transcriptional antiterminator RfaH
MFDKLQRVAQERDYTLVGGERWYVVYTQPFQELVAQGHLKNQAFRVFLPRYARTIRHARRYSTTLAPLFPRYLFVVLNPEHSQWRSINGTRGVVSLIKQDANPLPIKRGVVESLIESSTDEGEVRFCPGLRPGQGVRLVAGPFAGQLGVLEQLGSSDRIRVLLGMMGGQVAIELQARNVVPLSERPADRRPAASS